MVLAALDRLSGLHRDVLVELYFRDRSVTEAAQVLGVPTGTVKSRSHNALRALAGGATADWVQTNQIAKVLV